MRPQVRIPRIATTPVAKTTTRKAFAKSEINEAKKLASMLEEKMTEVSALCHKVGNNEYLMRNGINMKADISSTTLLSGRTKIRLNVNVVMPK